MAFRKRGVVTRNCHVPAEMIEQYSMGRLDGSELEKFEEHLLICEKCQDRVALEDAFINGVRDAGKALAEQSAAPRRWSFALWPKPAWALGLAAISLLVFTGIEWRSWRGATAQPAIVMLQTVRGSESALAAAGRPLKLDFDLTGLPQFGEYKIEVVDAAGTSVLQTKAARHDNRSQTVLARGLAAGTYFARVYAPSGELLREYALAVRR
jgi:hypothetical protein